jgi:sphingosine kinase
VFADRLSTLTGQPMKADLFSVTMNSNRIYSFMSQAMGLMADLDIGTEHLRWMGDTRFLLGFLKGGKLGPNVLPLHLPISFYSRAA